MQIDGVEFSHGGTADMPFREVKHRFGIVSCFAQSERSKYDGSNIQSYDAAHTAAFKALAEKAKEVGAHAVLNVNLTITPVVYSNGTFFQASISGDAVTLCGED